MKKKTLKQYYESLNLPMRFESLDPMTILVLETEHEGSLIEWRKKWTKILGWTIGLICISAVTWAVLVSDDNSSLTIKTNAKTFILH